MHVSFVCVVCTKTLGLACVNMFSHMYIAAREPLGDPREKGLESRSPQAIYTYITA